MTHILSIDTSTSICSVALHANGELVAQTETFLDRSHSRNIAHMAEHVLAICEISSNNLDAYAVSAGPGSYTGMRIGSSTAKGFCFALDKPLVSVSSLYSMAAQLQHKSPGLIYVPMIDARRMEVYTATYNAQLEEISKEQALILSDSSFEEQLSIEKVLFGGDGSSKFKEICTNVGAFFATDAYPSAKFMGKIAFEKFEQQKFEDIAYFEPNYIKEFHTNSKVNI
ncbi:tRNA (adenosine(37)-N6)-threonylcarbamoyltransferase complex dimerization subunit type 1 TsaB [uncultured Cytophaga sp.]|uniref:tRNA (adenosine(37)-N6)-threonylcarbamoyltransferase complex dimerization subunit type 1 TsaB n=1 Tax=uncultured Cytophaga sp. TaxID=160238 RepID=UPI002639D9EB|nr:tRNA (adenosine(37)-N6)-threonylcarbamoyltransferase complex dimerization subunit type 1 TsaB [uncultured Cytophaga sp.]